MALLFSACAPGLDDPSRFEDDEVCDFDIQEDLLVPRCGTAPSCHVPHMPEAGLEFVTGGLAERLLRAEATTCDGHQLIDPESPSDSFLLTRVNAAPTCDGAPIDRMPYLLEPLNTRELTCLTRWVEAIAREAPPIDASTRDASTGDASTGDASTGDASTGDEDAGR
jgi:hypothetical protein